MKMKIRIEDYWARLQEDPDLEMVVEAIVKISEKKKRSFFNKEMKDRLTKELEINSKWDKNTRKRLAVKFGLRTAQIYKWYWDNAKSKQI